MTTLPQTQNVQNWNELEHHFKGVLKEFAPQGDINLDFSNETKEAMYALGYGCYENGKYDEAANIFRVLTLIETDAKKHWMGLGASLQMQKEYMQAIQAYGCAALLDTDSPYPYLHVAECFYANHQLEEAFEALSSAEEAAHIGLEYAELVPHLKTIREAWEKPKVTPKRET